MKKTVITLQLVTFILVKSKCNASLSINRDEGLEVNEQPEVEQSEECVTFFVQTRIDEKFCSQGVTNRVSNRVENQQS